MSHVKAPWHRLSAWQKLPDCCKHDIAHHLQLGAATNTTGFLLSFFYTAGLRSATAELQSFVPIPGAISRLALTLLIKRMLVA